MFGKLKANLSRKVGINLVKIRGFVGVIGSGKNHACQELVKNKGYVEINFADSLRNMVWKMLEWQPDTPEEYDLFKKGEYYVPRYGKLNGRIILQKIGSMMREIDPDFWVKQYKKDIDKAISMGYNNICCSDLRYENELQALKDMAWKADVKIQFCDYHSSRYDNTQTHESEKMAQKFLKEGYKDGDMIYG